MKLFKDNLHEIYANILTLDSEESFHVLKDYFTALNDAMEAAADHPKV